MPKRIQIVFPILVLCIRGMVTFITLEIISPPPPEPSEAPATVFSAGRAMHDLAVIPGEPHHMEIFPSHVQVYDHLLKEIRAISLEPQFRDTFGLRAIEPRFVIGGGIENILVMLPGTNPNGAILLITHYNYTPDATSASMPTDVMTDLGNNLQTLEPGSIKEPPQILRQGSSGEARHRLIWEWAVLKIPDSP